MNAVQYTVRFIQSISLFPLCRPYIGVAVVKSPQRMRFMPRIVRTMEEYTEIVLNLEGCRYLGEIHSRIKETFSFPDYYGENWDAFLDAFRTVGVPDKIIIRGESSIPKELVSQLDRMHSTLEYMRGELSGFGQTFSYEIKD